MFVRALSALIALALLYAIWFLFEAKGLIAVTSLASLICCFEFAFMIEPKKRLNRFLFVCISFLSHLIFGYYSQSFLVFMGLFIILVSLFTLLSQRPIEERVSQFMLWTLGAFYCGFLTGAIVLGLINFGLPFFIALLLISFATDTCAYLGGKAFGNRPLAPLISPNKTLEGSLSGLLGGCTAAYLYLSTITTTAPSPSMMILLLTGFLASCFSQVGDLFESMIKRFSGVKDSGKILPGHGGVLDRVDGVLFAAPVVYAWMSLYLSH